jgi:hypothetical protein
MPWRTSQMPGSATRLALLAAKGTSRRSTSVEHQLMMRPDPDVGHCPAINALIVPEWLWSAKSFCHSEASESWQHF